jgi:hypothetical protein
VSGTYYIVVTKERFINGLISLVVMVRTHKLPRGSGNALNLEGVTDALDNFYRDRSRLGMLWEDKDMLSEYLDFIADIAKQAELAGSVVYYPFGAVDAKHPFLMIEGARDVFSQGRERFGSVRSIENFMKYAEAGDKSAINHLNWSCTQYLTFLETGDRQNYSGWSFPRTDGIGGLAVADIVSVLGGKIKGIHYFEINDDGEPVFIPESELQRDRNYDNAVIHFRDESRRVKRFWYSRYFFKGDSPDREKFKGYVDRMNFDVLFIKGAVNMFAEEDPEMRTELFDLILDPARKQNAGVITDERTDRYGFPLKIYEDGDRNRPIWKPGNNPKIIALPWKGFENHKYGYGKTVYVGRGEDLIDRETTLSEIKGYEPTER